MECPVCLCWSYEDICPKCGYDLENNIEYQNLSNELSYSEINKHNKQIDILKKNYQIIQDKDKKEEINKADEFYKLGKNCTTIQEYLKAKAYYELAIEEGNVDALVDLAIMYREGKIRKKSIINRIKDLRQSADLLEKAVELGNTKAMILLAEVYLLFYGRFPSRKKALGLYQKAINLDDENAVRDLINKYTYGYGILFPNQAKAEEYEELYEFM